MLVAVRSWLLLMVWAQWGPGWRASRLRGKRSRGNRSRGNRSRGNRSSGNRPAGNRPAGNRSRGKRSRKPIEGYLVGAYCIEDELLTWRRLRFPHGVSPGDMIVFVNTAGYQMHILESASHQIPLAANLIVSELAEQWVRDRIDTTP